MDMKAILVDFPEDVIEQLDELKLTTGKPRNELIREAVKLLLLVTNKQDADDIEAVAGTA